MNFTVWPSVVGRNKLVEAVVCVASMDREPTVWFDLWPINHEPLVEQKLEKRVVKVSMVVETVISLCLK